MIVLSNRYPARLASSSGADLAVIWSRGGRAVVCSQPADLLAAGTTWRATEPLAIGVLQRDPTAVAASLPSLRRAATKPPAAAVSLELSSDLVLSLGWYVAPAGDELPAEFRNLLDDVSAVAAALEAAESAQALSRAGAESMLDPQVSWRPSATATDG
jgi:hypothetical protein